MKVFLTPSPNFNDRKEKLDMLVLHYTGMEDGPSALDRMRDPLAEVSAHYMVDEDGSIYRLVDEDKRAWHAGVSVWQGDRDLNSRSIGIEMVNGGHNVPLADGSLPPFMRAQMDAVIQLCQGILKRHNIPQSRIVGHSDIAPDRKEDPGEHFPWEELSTHGIGLWPGEVSPSPSLTDTLTYESIGLEVSDLQKHLLSIGYDIEPNGLYDAHTAKCVTAFQRRWQQDQVTGDADAQTLALVEAVAKLAK